MQRLRTRRKALLALFASLMSSACQVDPFCIDCPGAEVDAGSEDGGMMDAPLVRIDAQGDAFSPDAYMLPDGCTPGAPELCNGHDDDCDRMVDEGIDLMTDVRNCGGCGMRCAPPNAFGICMNGNCRMGDCAAGYIDLDRDPANGCEYRCTATADREMRCDRRDEDCDGRVDEDFDLMNDVMNCGTCGRSCRLPRASAACRDGNCVLERCEDGYVDLDGMATNGCEYRCTPSSPPTERCNLQDDDCDGMIDEGNPEGGGMCGTDTGECVAGRRVCRGGRLECEGEVGPNDERCNNLDDDCDGQVDEGNPEGGRACGSSVGVCVPGREVCMGGRLECMGGVRPGMERCNGLDDDCDGMIDEGNPEGGGMCGTDTGECVAGVLTCRGGGLVCMGEVGPRSELCNALDDDCDGRTDEGFDLMNDIRNCGMCGRTCMFMNAIAGCRTGNCVLLACRPGFVNLDGDAANGCEYACTPSGSETCNGVDDDCDGRTDEGVTPPPTLCSPNGVCRGTTARCAGAMGFVCDYPPTYQSTETLCDDLDNDCDGRVDEAFPNKGMSCSSSGMGACRRTGMLVCNAMRNGVVCNATPGTPSPEECNGIDDDCDGRVDENPRNAWVEFTLAGGARRWIFQYEASRPDATATSPGTGTPTVACSRAGVIPWSNVTATQAQAACAGIGARLCTEIEWQRACETAAAMPCTYSYASMCGTYQGMVCNGRDADPMRDEVRATGAFPMCYANWGSARIFDMSGNLQEWTAPRAADRYPMRGGSYNDIAGGLTCQYSFEVAAGNVALPNTGFRCCRDTAPP